MEINNIFELDGHERPANRPSMARERFTPSEKTKQFLDKCREKGYDISTIINLAIDCFAPKTTPSGYTWEGIDNVINGRKKWF